IQQLLMILLLAVLYGRPTHTANRLNADAAAGMQAGRQGITADAGRMQLSHHCHPYHAHRSQSSSPASAAASATGVSAAASAATATAAAAVGRINEGVRRGRSLHMSMLHWHSVRVFRSTLLVMCTMPISTMFTLTSSEIKCPNLPPPQTPPSPEHPCTLPPPPPP
ncbi:unnamed protein product, partial [Sphagnum compactum]